MTHQEQNRPINEIGLKPVIDPKIIQDCHINPIKYPYTFEKPGFYNIYFSNEHSWYGTKVLKYRWSVLVPSQKKQK